MNSLFGPDKVVAPWNIWLMCVTLDVSKLSGWLNADALCPVESRAYDAG